MIEMNEQNDLMSLKSVWENLARHDPLWAILSDPDQKGRKWDLSLFMKNGEVEIASLMGRLKRMGKPGACIRALDFGCGVGRLSQPLCLYFSEVIGVDISPTMIRLAQKLNRFDDRCRYLENDSDSLAAIPDRSVDLVYSNIVLQHIPPSRTKEYIKEFMRVAKSDGIVVFQLPSRRIPESQRRESPKPMPDAAYKARISLVTKPPREILPGHSVAVSLRIINDSSLTWETSSASPLRAGNHWLQPVTETPEVWDDGRVDLPEGLEPGQSCTVSLVLTAPASPGEYICEIDVVHEIFTWFGVHDSPTVRFPVTVTEGCGAGRGRSLSGDRSMEVRMDGLPDMDSLLPPPLEKPPEYSVFGVPRNEVESLLNELGGHLLSAERDNLAGPDWEAYLYFVSPPESA